MDKYVEIAIENPISVDQIENGVFLGNVTAGKFYLNPNYSMIFFPIMFLIIFLPSNESCNIKKLKYFAHFNN